MRVFPESILAFLEVTRNQPMSSVVRAHIVEVIEGMASWVLANKAPSAENLIFVTQGMHDLFSIALKDSHISSSY